MKTWFVMVFFILFFYLNPFASFGKDIPKYAVWDLEPRNIPAPHARELTSILVSEISKLGRYEVYSQENVRTLAGWTAERMLLGCTDTKCLTALGQMDIAKLISGSVGKIGTKYSISLNLFDTQKVKAENAVSEFCNSENELIELVQRAIRKLLGETKGEVAKQQPRVFGIKDKCEVPIWNVGDKWIYQIADGSKRVEEVVGEEGGIYILSSEGSKGYDKKTMNIKWFITPKGKKEKYNKGNKNLFDFPLYVGKHWETDYSDYGPSRSKVVEYKIEYKIEIIEEVLTKAGTFQAFKIRMNQSRWDLPQGGAVIWWYSPQVKNWVKRQTNNQRFYRETEWEHNAELFTYELK
jgi:hypothetical protein